MYFFLSSRWKRVFFCPELDVVEMKKKQRGFFSAGHSSFSSVHILRQGRFFYKDDFLPGVKLLAYENLFFFSFLLWVLFWLHLANAFSLNLLHVFESRALDLLSFLVLPKMIFFFFLRSSRDSYRHWGFARKEKEKKWGNHRVTIFSFAARKLHRSLFCAIQGRKKKEVKWHLKELQILIAEKVNCHQLV